MLIGEVAQRCGVSARMLRHYDSLGLVQPTGRTVGGYREYTTDDVRRIFYVEGLRTLGLSLRQIGRTLEDPGFSPSTMVGELIRRTKEDLRQQQELLDRLRTVEAAEPSAWADVARVVDLLHGLGSPHAARRQQAVFASVEQETVPAELLARAVLMEAETNVAGALRWALARANDHGDAVDVLATALTSDDVEVRQRAVRALAELPGDEVTVALTSALADPDSAVRSPAALAAAARGVTSAVPTLVEMVVTGPNDVEAAEQLAALAQDPTMTDQIMGALTDELAAHPNEPVIRLRLVQAFAELPGAVAGDTLRQLATDGDRQVALTAAALASIVEEVPAETARPGNVAPGQQPSTMH